MTARKLSVEFFYAAGCSKCAASRDALREAAQAAGPVEWQEIDIARNPHRAVDAGVVSTPAVSIDGELVFKAMPSAAELRKAIQARKAAS